MISLFKIASLIYKRQASSAISIYDRNTGLQSISFPRRFRSHAISSSAEITRTSAPADLIDALTRASLSARVSPVYENGNSNTGSCDSSGLSAQSSSTRSSSPFRVTFLSPSLSSILSAKSRLTVLPSKPTTFSDSRWSYKYSSIFGTPGCPLFISSIVLPASCASA